jgi:enoyl-CoA hydratase
VADYQFLRYESVDDGAIVRIALHRPDFRNAQNRGLLVELGEAFMAAEADDAVRVVILSGDGPMFSAGHDLGTRQQQADLAPGPDQHVSARTNGGTRSGAEARMLQEWHYFFTNTRRWRDLRKITIAQVHGPVFSAGLMLMWCCDLITAADDTVFADVVATRLGMCGVEYFAHPWELGPRRTKALMLTGDSIDADEAYRIGMVTKVVPPDRLAQTTLDLARRIAQLPSVAALLVKESVNQTVDNMGFHNALQACFSLHQLNHAHWAEVTKGELARGTPEFGVPDWRNAPPVNASQRDRA